MVMLKGSVWRRHAEGLGSHSNNVHTMRNEEKAQHYQGNAYGTVLACCSQVHSLHIIGLVQYRVHRDFDSIGTLACVAQHALHLTIQNMQTGMPGLHCCLGNI